MRRTFRSDLFAFLLLLATCGASPESRMPAIASEIQSEDQGSAQKRPDSQPAKTQIAHPEIPRMPAAELARLLRKKADIVILDTQPADGYEMWHIPTAVNIPYIATADPMDRQLILMNLPADKQIIIYCLCEEGTDSAQIALELKQLGYSGRNIKVLEGGLVLWDAAGHPMVKQNIPE